MTSLHHSEQQEAPCTAAPAAPPDKLLSRAAVVAKGCETPETQPCSGPASEAETAGRNKTRAVDSSQQSQQVAADRAANRAAEVRRLVQRMEAQQAAAIPQTTATDTAAAGSQSTDVCSHLLTELLLLPPPANPCSAHEISWLLQLLHAGFKGSRQGLMRNCSCL